MFNTPPQRTISNRDLIQQTPSEIMVLKWRTKLLQFVKGRFPVIRVLQKMKPTLNIIRRIWAGTWPGCLTNLIKIKYLTCSIILVCHGVGDLKKPHYSSNANDPICCGMSFSLDHILEGVRHTESAQSEIMGDFAHEYS